MPIAELLTLFINLIFNVKDVLIHRYPEKLSIENSNFEVVDIQNIFTQTFQMRAVIKAPLLTQRASTTARSQHIL